MSLTSLKIQMSLRTQTRTLLCLALAQITLIILSIIAIKQRQTQMWHWKGSSLNRPGPKEASMPDGSYRKIDEAESLKQTRHTPALSPPC